jgi:hypothetical protein
MLIPKSSKNKESYRPNSVLTDEKRSLIKTKYHSTESRVSHKKSTFFPAVKTPIFIISNP